MQKTITAIVFNNISNKAKFLVRASVLLVFISNIMSISGCHSDHQNSEKSNWSFTGGDAGVSRFSELDQVNKKNVSGLKVAWTYHSGDMKGGVQNNPVIVNGVIYVTTPAQQLIAINGEDGKEIWRFNPARAGETFGGLNRGVAYWTDGANDRRIYYTSGGFLNAVDAETGKAILSFGDQGRINLNEGLVKPAGQMGITSPASPVIYKGLVIVGGMSWSAPSNVSAFDVHTGLRKWIFHVIPQPGEYGYDTWGDKNFWKNGIGVNVWGGLSVDVKNGMLYFGTGQPKYDLYRPNNKGMQLYGNCILALNAQTGKRVWHYQIVHHDLWDLDAPCAPILVTLNHNGQKIPGVVQLSKTGNVFMFNRLTGELLSRVEERPVRKSLLPGEEAYPTQPFVTWPEAFSRQVVEEKDLTDLSPEAHTEALKRFKNSDTGWFPPPSVKGSLYYGVHGGAEWSGGAYEPKDNVIYVNANELAWHVQMHDVSVASGNKNDDQDPGRAVFLQKGCVSCHGANREGMGNAPNLTAVNKKYNESEIVQLIRKGRGGMPSFAQIPEDEVHQLAKYLLNIKNMQNGSKVIKKPSFQASDFNKFLDKNNYAATKPPYGTLNAINLNTGKIEWKVPLGEYKELTAKGIPVTGTENFGGCIVTKGGLVFIGASRDEKFRAFDKDSGKILWETQLPYGGYSVPSTYAVNGKQYIVIVATGGGKLGTKTGDAYIAFALPN